MSTDLVGSLRLLTNVADPVDAASATRRPIVRWRHRRPSIRLQPDRSPRAEEHPPPNLILGSTCHPGCARSYARRRDHHPKTRRLMCSPSLGRRPAGRALRPRCRFADGLKYGIVPEASCVNPFSVRSERSTPRRAIGKCRRDAGRLARPALRSLPADGEFGQARNPLNTAHLPEPVNFSIAIHRAPVSRSSARFEGVSAVHRVPDTSHEPIVSDRARSRETGTSAPAAASASDGLRGLDVGGVDLAVVTAVRAETAAVQRFIEEQFDSQIAHHEAPTRESGAAASAERRGRYDRASLSDWSCSALLRTNDQFRHLKECGGRCAIRAAKTAVQRSIR